VPPVVQAVKKTRDVSGTEMLLPLVVSVSRMFGIGGRREDEALAAWWAATNAMTATRADLVGFMCMLLSLDGGAARSPDPGVSRRRPEMAASCGRGGSAPADTCSAKEAAYAQKET